MREKIITILGVFLTGFAVAVLFVPTVALVLLCKLMGVKNIGDDPHSGSKPYG